MENSDPEASPAEVDSEAAQKYKGAVISHIKRGQGPRRSNIYAHIHAADGTLLVAATLDYCCERMRYASVYF